MFLNISLLQYLISAYICGNLALECTRTKAEFILGLKIVLGIERKHTYPKPFSCTYCHFLPTFILALFIFIFCLPPWLPKEVRRGEGERELIAHIHKSTFNNNFL